MPIDTNIRGADVVAAARAWLATPWRHQGRSRGLGCDCAGLVIGVAHDLGLTDFDFTAYGRTPHADTLRALCDAHMQRIERAAVRPGDIYLMRWLAEPQHLAIATDLGIVHAYAAARRVVEHRLDDTWSGRIVQAYRLPGVV